MRRWIQLGVVSLILGGWTLVIDSATAQGQEAPQTPQVGDAAPDWKMVGSDGKTYRLSDFRGKQAVVVAWYPAALTGG